MYATPWIHLRKAWIFEEGYVDFLVENEKEYLRFDSSAYSVHTQQKYEVSKAKHSKEPTNEQWKC